MSYHRVFLPLILLIFAISIDQVRNEKINCRRSSGLVAYPRIGRSSEMTEFQRTSRPVGIIPYPRPGRSNLPLFYIGADRKHDMGSINDLEILPTRESEIESTYEPEYDEFHPDLGAFVRHLDKIYPKLKQHEDLQSHNLALRSYPRQGQITWSLPRTGRDTTDHDPPTNVL
ncbi:PREDICTED: CAPA peptides-like [Polistes canadensis]|uniref:CAPA peptides-like n=1 Tax=Polistes canadensis TaxID=91411 RepID=UPI000718E628|nr:PREDICTED: CAPA peptides-like [Polistes canadensis]